MRHSENDAFERRARRGAAGGSGAVAERMFGRLGRCSAAPCAYEFEESAFASARGYGGVWCSELHELVRPCCDGEPAASARICFCGSVIVSPDLRGDIFTLL